MRVNLETKLARLSEAVNRPLSKPEQIEHLAQCFRQIAETLKFLPNTCRLDFAYNMMTVFSAACVILISFDPSERKTEEFESQIESALGINFQPKMGGIDRKLAEWRGVDIITMIAHRSLDE